MTDRQPKRRPRRRAASKDGSPTVVPVDPSGVTHARRDKGNPSDEVEPGSFAARVIAKHVNLVRLIREGIAPREYHALSEAMFARGGRHLIAAPKKTGKSIANLAHFVRMVLAGERIVILDRENGRDVYAERLELIMAAFGLSNRQRGVLEDNLLYYEYPKLKRDDPDNLVSYFVDEVHADLVVFDSQRKFLTDYGLKENISDDYDLFMVYAVDPLHEAKVTTVIFDNTGWGDQTRSRGASTKGDLNEVLLHMEKVSPFDKHTSGQVKLVIDESRFGDRGEWTMDIGNGTFGEWVSDGARVRKLVVKVAADKPEFEPTTCAVLKDAGEIMGTRRLIEAIRDRGVRIRSDDARRMFKEWAKDSSKPILYRPGVGYEYDTSGGVSQDRDTPVSGTQGDTNGVS